MQYEVILSEEFDEQIAKFEQYDQIADKHLTDAMRGSLTGIQGLTRLNMPVFQRRARNSIQTEVKQMGSQIQGRVFSDIQSPYPYPLVIEFGRKPGKMPPPSKLVRWVHLQMGVPLSPLSRIRSATYNVARSIGRKGIKGKFPLKKAVESSMVRIGMLFREALDRIANEMAVK